MERKSFLGITIGALIGLLLLFVAYLYFFKDTETATNIRNGIGNFLPLGGDSVGNNNGGPDGDPSTPDEFPNTAIVIPKLRQLSNSSIAGFIAFDRATTTRTLVGTTTVFATTTEMAARYMERSTGHIYEASELSLDTPRISNTTLGIFEEAWFSNTQSFVARRFDATLSDIETYVGSILRIGTTSEFRTAGTYLGQNPTSVALRGTSLFTLYETEIGADGYLTQTAPIKEVRVFSSALSGWNAEWVNKDLLLMVTKPNSSNDGFAFTYNPNTKRMTEILGEEKPGLTAKLNSTATAILFSESRETETSFYMGNLSKNIFLKLSSNTLPEKCVFSTKNVMIAYCAVPRPMPAGYYPEDWYKGKVEFTDAIVKIDIEKNIETTLINLEQESGVAIDATKLSLNERENFLFFQNKQDNFLWSFDLRD